MKTLTNLQIDGLKNHARTSLTFGQFLALSGQNGAGKTAHLQGIRLAILGYEPEVGKTLAATRTIAGGDGDIQVALTFADGFGIRRRFGKSLETDVAPPRGERTEKEKQARIEDETGAFVPSFDLAAFTALSAEKRREMLFAMLPRDAANLTLEGFREWLGYEGADNPIRVAIDKLWTEKVMAEQSPINGLASAIAFAHQHMLEADSDRQAQVKVLQAAEEDARRLTEQVVTFDEGAAERLQAEQAAVERRIGEIRERAAEGERIARQHREREHQLRVLDMQEQDGLAKQAERVERLKALVSTPDPRIEAAAAEHAKAVLLRGEHVAPTEGEIEEAGKALEYAGRKLKAQRDAVAYTSGRVVELEMRRHETAARLDTLGVESHCPLCGGASEMEALRERLSVEVANLDRVLEDARGDHTLALGVEETVAVEYERANKALGELHARALGIGRLDAAVREADLRVQAARADAANRQALLEREVDGFADQVERIRQERERLQAMEIAPAPEVDHEELETANQQAAGIRERMRALQEAAKQAGKAEAERERAGRERAKLEKKTERWEKLKGLHRGLQKLRGQVIRQLVAPVEERANELLQTIDQSKSFAFLFEREGKDTFDFGFEEDGAFRSYDAASTGEAAFVAVVLVAALVSTCAPAWRVLMVDNIEKVDDDRRRWLMLALTQCADLFDNVIVAGCCSFPDVDGWQLVEVGTREAVAA